MAIFDVDGVMTDGSLSYSSTGEEIKVFHVADGLGLKALMDCGLEVAILTGRSSPIVERRAAELGIRRVIQGSSDKGEALTRLLAPLDITPAQCAYAGDDLIDWPAMRQCGFKAAPANAVEWIRQRVDFVSSRSGGQGAVREICERILADQGLLTGWQARFS